VCWRLLDVHVQRGNVRLMAGITFRVGQPKGLAHIEAKINAQLSKGIAQKTVERVQRRVKHPAAQALKAIGVNQYVADVTGPRGGPGPVVPVRARALAFVWKGGPKVFKRVDGAGLLPLITSEAEKVTQYDADAIVRSIKI